MPVPCGGHEESTLPRQGSEADVHPNAAGGSTVGLLRRDGRATATVGTGSHARPSPNRSGTYGANLTSGQHELDDNDYSLSVSDLASNSLYKSGRYGDTEPRR